MTTAMNRVAQDATIGRYEVIFTLVTAITDMNRVAHATAIGRYEDIFNPVLTANTAPVTSSTAASHMIAVTQGAGYTLSELFIGRDDLLAGYESYAAPNWDGYGADPITPETLAAARNFINMLPRTFGEPDIAPGSDGTIGLEWAFNNRPLRKLFIDIGPGPVWSGFWRRATGEKKTLPTTPITAATELLLAALFKDLNA